MFKRRRRVGSTLFVPLVLVLLGGLLFLGVDSRRGTDADPVERVESPVLAKAPDTVEDIEAREAAAEEKAAAENKAAEEAEAKKAAEKEKDETAQKDSGEKEQQAPPPPEEVLPPAPADKTLYLTVPKMGRENDVVYNTDDPALLDEAAVKLPSTGFPWQDNANTYIAAHAVGYQGTGSLYQFAKLPNMTYGDVIYLTDANGSVYTYEVSEILTVTPYDTWVTNPIPNRDMVTLQTCVNPPAYDMRLVVRADRVAIDPA